MGLFNEFKTNIFSGINDLPRLASETEPSNGSDLVNKVNGLCDELNQSFPEFWGNTSLFVNPKATGEEGDGLTELTPKHTEENIIELIKTKTINSTLTIIFLDDVNDDTNFDLFEVIASSNAKLIFKNNTDKIQYKIDANSPQELIVNIPENLSIEFDGFYFNVTRAVTITSFSKVSFINCQFGMLVNYQDELLNLSNLKVSKLSGNLFVGNTDYYYSYYSNLIIKTKDVGKLVLGNNNFERVDGTFVDSENSTVEIAGEQQYSGTPLSHTFDFITITNGTVIVEKESNIQPQHIVNINSEIKKAVEPTDAKKLMNYYFSSVANKTIILFFNPIKSSFIKSLSVIDNDSSANYNLKINDNTLSFAAGDNKNKVFARNDNANRLNANSSDSLKLVVSGNADDISIQIELIEF